MSSRRMLLSPRTATRAAVAGLCALVASGAHAGAAPLPLTSAHLTTLTTCGLISHPADSFSQDTYVDQALPTTNNSAGQSLGIASGTGTNQRIYIGFSLNCLHPIPVGATVRSATLRLYVRVLPARCETYDLFAMPAFWSYITITWNNQPLGTGLNNPPPVQRTTMQQVGSPATCGNHTARSYVNWDVTGDVARFLAGTLSNNGWMIRDDVEGQAATVAASFSSSDRNVRSEAPTLMISYTT